MRGPAILFIHDHFPAQFGSLGDWLAAQGWDVALATMARPACRSDRRILHYAPHREPSAETHPYAQAMDRAALKGQAFVRAAREARRDGYRPDIVVAHSGWGAGLYARDVFPEAAFVPYCEWWYRFPGPDVAYLATLEGVAPPGGSDAPMLERGRNAPIALDLAGAEAAICPTPFQASQFPHPLQAALTVLHDGIDTVRFRPDPKARRGTLGGLVPETAPVVTYATRGMEPHRGFPQFMAALARVLKRVPDAVAVIAGENRVAYGGNALRRTDWKAEALARHDFDRERIRFTGHLAPEAYLRLLQRSDAHVYLTVPFVLSWSMLEAMSTGCALVASDTEPVRDFADPDCAALADMAAPEALAEAIIEALQDDVRTRERRAAARARIEREVAADRMFRLKRELLASLLP